MKKSYYFCLFLLALLVSTNALAQKNNSFWSFFSIGVEGGYSYNYTYDKLSTGEDNSLRSTATQSSYGYKVYLGTPILSFSYKNNYDTFSYLDGGAKSFVTHLDLSSLAANGLRTGNTALLSAILYAPQLTYSYFNKSDYSYKDLDIPFLTIFRYKETYQAFPTGSGVLPLSRVIQTKKFYLLSYTTLAQTATDLKYWATLATHSAEGTSFLLNYFPLPFIDWYTYSTTCSDYYYDDLYDSGTDSGFGHDIGLMYYGCFVFPINKMLVTIRPQIIWTAISDRGMTYDLLYPKGLSAFLGVSVSL